ncbi:hypothetical protein TNCV_1913941, partial [Trichonephila clavipes]
TSLDFLRLPKPFRAISTPPICLLLPPESLKHSQGGVITPIENLWLRANMPSLEAQDYGLNPGWNCEISYMRKS